MIVTVKSVKRKQQCWRRKQINWKHCAKSQRRINVLAVCPGPMDTEFLEVANIKGNSKMFRTLPYCKPSEVVERSLRASERNRAVYTNRFFFKFYRVLAKILPHALVVKMAKT